MSKKKQTKSHTFALIEEDVKQRDNTRNITENSFYRISFEKYIKKDCEVKDLVISCAKKTILWFRDIGLTSEKEELNKINKSDKAIIKVGNYRYLFNGLEPDVEIKEHSIGDAQRVFYYIDNYKKSVNIILIKNSHIETK